MRIVKQDVDTRLWSALPVDKEGVHVAAMNGWFIIAIRRHSKQNLILSFVIDVHDSDNA